MNVTFNWSAVVSRLHSLQNTCLKLQSSVRWRGKSSLGTKAPHPECIHWTFAYGHFSRWTFSSKQRRKMFLKCWSKHNRSVASCNGIRNLGHFCLWNPKSWALEFGIQLKGSGIWPATGMWNLSFTDKLESSTWNLESTGWNPGSNTVLNSLTWSEAYKAIRLNAILPFLFCAGKRLQRTLA